MLWAAGPRAVTRRAVGLLVVALGLGFVAGLGLARELWPAASTGSPTAAGVGPAGPSVVPSNPAASPGPASPAPSSPAGAAGPGASVPVPAGPTTRVVPVLMYHRISDPAPGVPYPGLYVSPASFDAQMHALQDAGWHTITAGELGQALAADRPVPVRTFVVMFDDGYTDNVTNALPILQRYGFVATFSVVARGGGSMMDSAQLAQLVRAGMEIGNHTLSHANVSRLTGASLDLQIQGGAQRIEARLASQGIAMTPTTFVYPSGHVGSAALVLLARMHYRDAFTEQPGDCVIGRTPPLQIPRIRVSRSESLAGFLASMPVEPRP